jgi:plasmid maintenance system antidote protein VapI
VIPPFDHFYFIDMNPEKTAHLATLCHGRRDVGSTADTWLRMQMNYDLAQIRARASSINQGRRQTCDKCPPSVHQVSEQVDT